MSYRSRIEGFADRLCRVMKAGELVGCLWGLGGGAIRLPVLYLHGVRREERGRFEGLLTELVKEYRFIRLDELGGRREDGEREAMLAFDDALESVLENALPALERLKCPATVFVPTGWVGKQAGWLRDNQGRDGGVMPWEKIIELDSPMLRFEGHTVIHPHLRKLGLVAVREELTCSKATLEEKLGRKVEYLCYPFGEYDARSEHEAKRAGYVGAFSSIHSIWQPRCARYAMRRLLCPAEMNAGRVREALAGAWEWKGAYHMAKRGMGVLTGR